MEIPEEVAQIQSYTQLKSKRAELEKQIKPLRKRLSDMETELSNIQSQEREALSRVDQSMLVDRSSIKTINGLLSGASSIRTSQGEFPVGCAVLQSGKKRLQISIVFSQPLFSGWRTETPYKSWQMCPMQLDTPEPPDENHIPEYRSLVEQDMDLSCWEQVGAELRLWGSNGSGVLVFSLREAKIYLPLSSKNGWLYR